jgi:hypothetical protein
MPVYFGTSQDIHACFVADYAVAYFSIPYLSDKVPK